MTSIVIGAVVGVVLYMFVGFKRTNAFFRKRDPKLWAKGYTYATRQLHNNRPMIELEAEAANPFDFNDFDRGMIDAMLDWKKQL